MLLHNLFEMNILYWWIINDFFLLGDVALFTSAFSLFVSVRLYLSLLNYVKIQTAAISTVLSIICEKSHINEIPMQPLHLVESAKWPW